MWLGCLLVATIPFDDVRQDRVDLVEVNHFYDETGRHIFDQLIFYDWHPERCRHEIRAWRMVRSPRQIPRWDWGKERRIQYLGRRDYPQVRAGICVNRGRRLILS
jgi:hypothetical protein